MNIVEYLLTLHRGLEGHLRNIRYLVFIVLKHFVDVAFSLRIDASLFLTEIQSTDKLANYDEIDSLTDYFGFERREVRKVLGKIDGPNIGEGVVAAPKWQ